jgi:hypothetical protein
MKPPIKLPKAKYVISHCVIGSRKGDVPLTFANNEREESEWRPELYAYAILPIETYLAHVTEGLPEARLAELRDMLARGLTQREKDKRSVGG